MVVPSSSSQSSPPATVLIVEDERIVARDLQATLEDLGYVVPVIADTGAEAIRQAEALHPNLVLMDIHLIGEMDGITAAQEISSRFDIPIIYVTAHADEATLSRAKLTGPFGYILKPFEDRELSITIEIALYKHNLDTQLLEKTQWLSAILKNMGDGVVATDARGYLTFVNPAAQVILDCQPQEVLDRHVTDIMSFIDQDTDEAIDNPLVQVLQSKQAVFFPDFKLLSLIKGKAVAISDSVAPILSQNQRLLGAVMVFQDNTERQSFEAQLEHQAYHDSLTQLPNRSLFRRRLEAAIKTAQRNSQYQFSVLFLDLDRFKAINDTLGHLQGDQLLTTVAQRLQAMLRDTDTVARLGGDEFAILLGRTADLAEVLQVCDRILNEVRKPIMLNDQRCTVGISIGLALSSSAPMTADGLLQAADIALYRAKNAGRDRYEIFDQTMGDQVQQTLTLETSLRHAIEAGELQVAFQPILALESDRLVGFEALMRWQQPTGEFVAPGEFIQVAEESGLIVLADWAIMRQACEQLQAWQQSGLLGDQWVSVNVSGQQFGQPNFVAQVEAILRDTGLQPTYLRLEITETAVIQYPESAADILAQLKTIGVGILLDDFGTGYSSLSYLHQFPVDVLKIDKSFIRKFERSSRSAAIIRTILLLANALSMATVAEGIETEDQKALLLELNCPLGQGFLFQRPLLAEEMETELSRFLAH